MIILAGDFNSHVGVDRVGWESSMGHFGHGQMVNDSGLHLLSFATTNNFIVGNSHFRHLLKHQLTWRKILHNVSNSRQSRSKSRSDGCMRWFGHVCRMDGGRLPLYYSDAIDPQRGEFNERRRRKQRGSNRSKMT